MCSSGKVRYATEVDAMLALTRIHEQRDIEAMEKHERTYYDCWVCGGFHLTSWRTSEG